MRSIDVSEVRLGFNIDSISALSVSSNWLHLTTGPFSVVRINLDSPSAVSHIHIPKRFHSSCGPIKLLETSHDGSYLFAVTSRFEHFFFVADQQQSGGEFRVLSKLRGIETQCVTFNPRKATSLLLGTRHGLIFEAMLDSQAGEKYFKRDLRLFTQVWDGKECINSIVISKNNQIFVCCGQAVLQFALAHPESRRPQKESRFEALFKQSSLKLVEATDGDARMLTASPDSQLLSVVLGAQRLAFSRAPFTEWEFVNTKSTIKSLLCSNFHLLATGTTGILAVNSFDPKYTHLQPMYSSEICGGCTDSAVGTFWIFERTRLFEIRMENEMEGMWRLLANQKRFEEAAEITQNRKEKSQVLQMHGKDLLEKDVNKAAKLLGLSDEPLESACLDIMQHSKKDDEKPLIALLSARLAHTHSRAQQIMLTSWLVSIGDESIFESSFAIDYPTAMDSLLRSGKTELYLRVAEASGNIHACLSYHVAHCEWMKALDILRRHEPLDLVYEYANVLLQNSPRETVESWMRIQALDVMKLLPGIVSYCSVYRGPKRENQALRYLLHCAKHGSKDVFNPVMVILFQSKESEESEDDIIEFINKYAPADTGELDFALRVALSYNCKQSAIVLYSLMGLPEEAVQLCLDVGGTEMYEKAVELADKSTGINEELRKYLLRLVAHRVIATQGPERASKFVGLLRVGDLLESFPDFETLSALAPDIVKSLEQVNTRLNALNLEIDESLSAATSMHTELSNFRKRKVLIEPGEQCFLCKFPLVTRKLVVFPCQHGFHVDCVREHRKLPNDENVNEMCVLCSNAHINTIEQPLSNQF